MNYKQITVPSYRCCQIEEVAKVIMQLLLDSGNVNTVSDKLHNYFFIDKEYRNGYDIPEYIYVELNRYRFQRWNNPDRTVTFSLFNNNYES